MTHHDSKQIDTCEPIIISTFDLQSSWFTAAKQELVTFYEYPDTMGELEVGEDDNDDIGAGHKNKMKIVESDSELSAASFVCMHGTYLCSIPMSLVGN